MFEEAMNEWEEHLTYLHNQGLFEEAEWPASELERVKKKKEGLDTPY